MLRDLRDAIEAAEDAVTPEEVDAQHAAAAYAAARAGAPLPVPWRPVNRVDVDGDAWRWENGTIHAEPMGGAGTIRVNGLRVIGLPDYQVDAGAGARLLIDDVDLTPADLYINGQGPARFRG